MLPYEGWSATFQVGGGVHFRTRRFEIKFLFLSLGLKFSCVHVCAIDHFCFWSTSFSIGWNDFVITLLREFLYVICFNIRCIIWCLAYIFNLRPLKAKLRIIEAFGTFWQFLAIFAFLAELDNSKHFEPYLFFWPLRPFLALQPLWPSKAKKSGLFRHN